MRREYQDIFHLAGEPLTKTSAIKHRITTKADTTPINVKPHRLPQKHNQKVKRQVKKMLDSIIRETAKVSGTRYY